MKQLHEQRRPARLSQTPPKSLFFCTIEKAQSAQAVHRVMPHKVGQRHAQT